MNLTEVKDGILVTVSKIKESALKVKFMEMGISEGKPLRVLYRAPFGDPIAVDANGYVLSLRLSEASLVEVQ